MKLHGIVNPLLEWFARSARDLPWRRTRDPYAIWVSEIMLQQTRVSTALPYWDRWMRRLPDVVSLAQARPALLHKLWEGLGYYTRVRNMQRAAQQIVKLHQGQFPRDFEAVLALPGIGRYTAGAICSIAFNQPQPIVDGNVIRVLTRLYGIHGNPRLPRTNERLWQLAAELVQQAARRHSCPQQRGMADAGHSGAQGPSHIAADRNVRAPGARSSFTPADSHDHACSRFNQSLMELGALVCTPRQPLCDQCPVAQHCVARRLNLVDRLPALARRARPTERRFAAFIVCHGQEVMIRQRPAGVVNAHLWEFPNAELLAGNGDPAQAFHSTLGLRPRRLEPFFTVKHSITRYRITLDSYLATGMPAEKIPVAKGKWVNRTRLSRLPFTAAHGRLLRRLLTETDGTNTTRISSQ